MWKRLISSLIFLAALSLFLPNSSFAQPLSTRVLRALEAMFDANGNFHLQESTVANFPSSPPSGTIRLATDGDASDPCGTGGGSTRRLCEFDGSNWVTLGDGAGGTTPTLDQVFDQGKLIDGASSLANAVRIGIGTNDAILVYRDPTNGPTMTCIVGGVENDCDRVLNLKTGKSFIVKNNAGGTIASLTEAGVATGWGGSPAPVIRPYSAYHVSGNCAFDIFNSQEELYVANTAALLTADCILRLRFQLPMALPTGTLKALVTGRANATSNNGAFDAKWCVTAPEADECTVASEGTSTVTWAAGDAYQRKETKVTLDAAGGGTITAGYTLSIDFTIVDASHTLTVESGWRALLIWE